MVEVNNLSSEIIGSYQSFLSTIPHWFQQFITLFLLVLLIVVYSIFIWKLYRFIAAKNIIKLNLNQYNRSEHPFFTKLIASGLYFLEYIIILPFIIFFWFTFFTIFLILLTEGLELNTLLVISATIIAAIRMTSYYNEDLSKDLAKLLPFTLLAISITKPEFFNIERIISHITEIPDFLNAIVIYLLFIIILEIILRLFDFFISLFGLEEAQEIEETKKED